MKKLQLNKQTIAQLNNPDKVYGGALPVPVSYDGNYNPYMTCEVFPCTPKDDKHICEEANQLNLS